METALDWMEIQSLRLGKFPPEAAAGVAPIVRRVFAVTQSVTAGAMTRHRAAEAICAAVQASPWILKKIDAIAVGKLRNDIQKAASDRKLKEEFAAEAAYWDAVSAERAMKAGAPFKDATKGRAEIAGALNAVAAKYPGTEYAGRATETADAYK